MVLLSALLVAATALYPLSHLGFRDALQALLQNFAIARKQYQRQAGTHWYALELTATDHLTLQPVQGQFPVVGVWQNGLIVERIPAQLRRFLGITGRQISGEGARKPRDNSQPPHPLLHPFLIDVGVNLGGTEALVAEQGLEVHPLGPGVEPVGGVSVAPLVGRNLLLDAGRLQHPRPAAKLVKLKQFLF